MGIGMTFPPATRRALASHQSVSNDYFRNHLWHPDQAWEVITGPQWVVFSGINFPFSGMTLEIFAF